MRSATWSVGLVSPRSTCESIGAETPDRTASSRSESREDSRRARTREPTATDMLRTLSHTSVSVASGSRGPPSLASVTRSRSFTPPDVLVLGAGGVVGEAWLSGVLSGIEEQAGLDLRKVERFVG